MNNFINVRTQSYNNAKTLNSFKHNLRHTQTSLSNVNDESNYIIFNNNLLKINDDNKKELHKQISKMYKDDRSRHNEIYKNHYKRNLRDYQSSWFEGVFTFSDQMKEDLKNKKYTYNDLVKVAYKCLKEIAATYKAEIKYMVLHLDETTPHFHFHLSNFDDLGRSLWNQNKNKNFLSNLQDIGFKHFGTLGMQRGVKKEFSNSRYMSAKQFHSLEAQKLKTSNQTLQNELKALQSDLNGIKTQKKEIYQELKDLKEEKQEIRNNINLSTEEKKALLFELDKLQKDTKNKKDELQSLENQTRSTIKEINANKQNLLRSFENDANDILNNSKSLLSFNEDKLKQNIKNKLEEYSKLNTLSKLEEENQSLKTKLQEFEPKAKDRKSVV